MRKSGFWVSRPAQTPKLTEASGMVLIARSTGRIGLAWRSRLVQMGNCWGTVGGMMGHTVSPRENAIRELYEETGYQGELDMYLVYVFATSVFRYYNYAALVPEEFSRKPDCLHAWENDTMEWFSLSQLQARIAEAPKEFHIGLRTLVRNAEAALTELVLRARPLVTGAIHL